MKMKINTNAESLVAVERERGYISLLDVEFVYSTTHTVVMSTEQCAEKLNKIDTKDVEETSLKSIYKKAREELSAGSDP